MMNDFIELKREDGSLFLFSSSTGWEINDRGMEPAHWSNYKEGRNLNCGNTYRELYIKLVDKYE